MAICLSMQGVTVSGEDACESRVQVMLRLPRPGWGFHFPVAGETGTDAGVREDRVPVLRGAGS